MRSITQIFLSSVVLLLYLIGCSSTAQMATPEEDALAKNFQASPNESYIYIVRPKKMYSGGGLTDSVLVGAEFVTPIVDGLVIGNLSNGSYALVKVPPGKHIISAYGSYQGITILELTTKKENIYFVEMSLSYGSMMNMKILDINEGKKTVKEYNLIEML